MYTRNKYKLTIEDKEYLEEDKSGEYYYKEKVTLRAKERAGYDFIGWNTGETTDILTITIPAEDLTIKPIYKANTDTTYKIEHKYKKLNGEYEVQETIGVGTTGSTVTAPTKARTGFVTPSKKNVTIAGDGSSKVTYVYEREKYTLNVTDRTYLDEVSAENGSYAYETEITLKAKYREGYAFKWSDEDESTVKSFSMTENKTLSLVYTANKYTIKFNKNATDAEGEMSDLEMTYGTTKTLTTNAYTRTGYTFKGWSLNAIGSVDYQDKASVSNLVTENEGSITLYAIWAANLDTKYKVIHKKQNLDLETYKVEEIENLQGITNTEVTPEVKEYEGFISPEEKTVTLLEDGTLEVEYLYNREIYNFNISDRTYIEESSTANGSYAYGTTITVKAKNRAGYEFMWTDGDTSLERTIKIDKDIEIETMYLPNLETKYKVIHKKQNLDLETYTEEEENLQGVTDTEVIPAVKEYEGFTSPEVKEVTIQGDGTLEVEYIYTRNRYRLEVEESENVEEGNVSGEYLYEEEVTLTAKEREGYEFSRWSNGETEKTITIRIPGEDTSIKPIYVANENTKYKIKHKYKKLDGTYEEEEVIEGGTTGETVKAPLQEREGFISPEEKEVTIKADGSSEVTYIYERKMYNFSISDITYLEEESTINGKYPYETEIVLKAKEREGYEFEWTDGDTSYEKVFNLTEDKELSLIYRANKYEVIAYPNGGIIEETAGWTKDEEVLEKEVTYDSLYGTLPVATRAGYTFVEWNTKEDGTGKTIDGISKATINEDHLIYAIWIPNIDTKYKVIHKKQNIELESYTVEEIENLTGITDELVTPSVKTYKGFVSPVPREVIILGEGTLEVEYLYEREMYNLNVTDRTYLEENSTANGSYPYETKVTLRAKEREGYTFSWSDGITSLERTIDLTEDKELSLIYTPNSIKIKDDSYMKFDSDDLIIKLPKNQKVINKETLENNLIIKGTYSIVDRNEQEIENTSLVTTSSKIKLGSNDYNIVIIGDVNQDGEIDTSDLVGVFKKMMNQTNLNKLQLISADYNNDNEIDTSDLVGILKKMME